MLTMTETEVLANLGAKLDALGLSYMLTGSFALAFYAQPRMTRDIDIVLAIRAQDVDSLSASLSADFYIDANAARQAIAQERLFNLMHFATGLKIDLIVRKSSPYRLVEFDRRRQASLGSANIWIVSCEDLVLSKLDWMKLTQSDLQRRDISQLLEGPVDVDYLLHWAAVLGVEKLLKELMP